MDAHTVPPHDRTGQSVDQAMAAGGVSQAVYELIKASWPILAEHPVNQARRQRGENPANSIWLWGQGTRPKLPTFSDKFGLSGLVVSAVDLVRGLGVLAGLEVRLVEGATGWLDTNYAGKVQAVLEGLKDRDIAVLHVEAPDEAGHAGKADLKVRAITDFDAQVVGPVLKGLKDLGPHRVLLACDHHTPIELKTHSSEPVPFVLWDSSQQVDGGRAYNEAAAKDACGPQVMAGDELMSRLVQI